MTRRSAEPESATVGTAGGTCSRGAFVSHRAATAAPDRRLQPCRTNRHAPYATAAAHRIPRPPGPRVVRVGGRGAQGRLARDRRIEPRARDPIRGVAVRRSVRDPVRLDCESVAFSRCVFARFHANWRPHAIRGTGYTGAFPRTTDHLQWRGRRFNPDRWL